MNEIELYKGKTFESIKHIDEDGNEYWIARELQVVLDYKEWRKFEGVINKAKDACHNSNINVTEHFVGADKLSKRANNAEVIIKDYKLSRYACYLIVQNSDPRKRLKANVIIINKENNLLTTQDIFKYNKQYHNLKVIYDNTFHDKYFILDNKNIYHCGASINKIGYKTFSITLINDSFILKALLDRVYKIINN